MDKTDLMYGVAAVVIIVVIALVIKPMMTGQPVNTGIPTPTPVPTVTSLPVTPGSRIISTPVTTPAKTVPTTIPTKITPVGSVAFVDPNTYGVTLNESVPRGTRIDQVPANTSTFTYAKISGALSGTTQTVNIPYPYWELWYTAEPVVSKTSLVSSSTSSAKTTATPKPTAGPTVVGISQSGFTGSYSTVQPSLTIQVMDADDPNRIVRTISPPGGINPALWKSTGKTSTSTTKSGTSSSDTVTITDPRPWKERFFEGERRYYFIVLADALQSYSLEIRVPSRYL